MRELGICRGTMCQIKHSLFPCRFFRFILRLSSPGFVVATALLLWLLLNGLLLPGSMQTMTAIIMGFETSLENDQLSRVGALLLTGGSV